MKIPIITKEINFWKKHKKQKTLQKITKALKNGWKQKPLQMTWATIKGITQGLLIALLFLMISYDTIYCTTTTTQLTYNNQTHIYENKQTQYTTTLDEFLNNQENIQNGTKITCTEKPIKTITERHQKWKKLPETIKKINQQTNIKNNEEYQWQTTPLTINQTKK